MPCLAKQTSGKRPAFTIVELLVVITIIVVLLALLTPALDQAIYQAELAVCGANQHAIAAGAVSYALGNSRRYPDRVSPRSDVVWHPAVIYNGNDSMNAAFGSTAPGGPGAGSLVKHDDRQALRQFISLNGHLNDPLAGGLDFDNIDFDSHAYSNYILWFGFGYRGQQGMMKLGDRVVGRGHDTNPAVNFGVRRYDILTSDRDVMQVANQRRSQTGHPDAQGITRKIVLQNGQFDLEVTGTGADSLKMTASMWAAVQPRSEVELNFAFQDGSVRRFDRVKFFDRNMNTLPDLSDSRYDWFITVPPENR